MNNESRILVLTPSRSDLVVQSSRFFWRIPRREIYNLDLGMVSGPVRSFKNRGKKLDLIFILFEGWENGKERRTLDEIGRIFIPGALNDTKKIRKVDGDMFVNVGPENTFKAGWALAGSVRVAALRPPSP